jgi:hypothetical protein
VKIRRGFACSATRGAGWADFANAQLEKKELRGVPFLLVPVNGG